MSEKIKIGGTWKDVTSEFVKVAGKWKPVTKTLLKVGGKWIDASTLASNKIKYDFVQDDVKFTNENRFFPNTIGVGFPCIMHGGYGLHLPSASVAYVELDTDTGPELLKNTTFTDSSHLTNGGNPTVTTKNGWLDIGITDNGYPFVEEEIDTEIGSNYTFSCYVNYKAGKSNYLVLSVRDSSTHIVEIVKSKFIKYNGLVVVDFTATTAKTKIRYYVNAKINVKNSGSFAMPSVKKILKVNTKIVMRYSAQYKKFQRIVSSIPKSTHLLLDNTITNILLTNKDIPQTDADYCTKHPDALMDIWTGRKAHSGLTLKKTDMNSFYPCMDLLTYNGALLAGYSIGPELVPNTTFADTSHLTFNAAVVDATVNNGELTVKNTAGKTGMYPYALMDIPVVKGETYLFEAEVYNDSQAAAVACIDSSHTSYTHSHDIKDKKRWIRFRILFTATSSKINMRFLCNNRMPDGTFRDGEAKFRKPSVRKAEGIIENTNSGNTKNGYREKMVGPQTWFYKQDQYGNLIGFNKPGEISGAQPQGQVPAIDARYLELPLVDKTKKHHWVGGKCLEEIDGNITVVTFTGCKP